MTKDKALRLALELLEAIHTQGDIEGVVTPNGEIYIQPVITAIKAALLSRSDGEAKDEPVVWNEGVPAMLPKQKEGETFIVSYEPKLEAKDEPDKYAMDIECTKCGAKQSGVLTVHAAPPQRKPLSEEEIGAILEDVNAYGTRLYTFARAIEAAHGIKGEA